MAKEKVTLFKGKKVEKGTESKIREKPGQSNAGNYKTLSKSSFAGPNGTFPINDMAHARNALARAHFSPNPEKIKAAVYKKYPGLKKRHEEKNG